MRRNKYKYNARQNFIKEHIERYAGIYFVLISIFTFGFLAGTLNSAFLGEKAKGESAGYILSFVEAIKNKDVNDSLMLTEVIASNVKVVLYPWFLGFVVLGVPLTFIYIGLEGYAIGFTATTIINSLGWSDGLLFLFTGVVPKEIILIPIMLITSLNGIMFSKRMLKNTNIKKDIYQYVVVLIPSLLITVGIAFFETYVGVYIVKFIIKITA